MSSHGARCQRARELAVHVDGLLADAWDAGPRAVALGSDDDDVRLEPVGEPADVAIADLEPRPATVACLSALGHVTYAGHPDASRRRARITLAVTCCETVAVVRFEDGGVTVSDSASGELAVTLRSWAILNPCRL